MKRIYTIVLCAVLLLSACISAQAEGIVLSKYVTFTEGLLPFSKGGMYGYIDKNANIVIDARWEDAKSFSEGFAAVKFNGKYGYINKNGYLVIDPQWDVARPFSDGVACIATETDVKKFGLINTKGEIISEPQWDSIIEFKEGFAVVVKDGKYGFINKDGKLAIPCIYTKAFGFSEGFAPVYTDSGKGYINTSGEMVIFSSWVSIDSFRCGRACVSIEDIKGNKKYGYIDTTGNTVIDYKYDDATSFSNGYAYVKYNKNGSIIDLNGKVVLDNNKVAHSYSGSKGSSHYSIYLHARYEYGLIRVMQTSLSSLDFSSSQNYGFANIKGEIIVKGEWKYIGNFVNGYAVVENSRNKKGYISTMGEVVIPAQYDDATDFSEDGYAVVWKGNTWYIIDVHGNVLV